MEFQFKKGMKGACGNGITGTWVGYSPFRIYHGTLVIDSENMIPLKCETNVTVEVFSNYVEIRDGHYVPLKIKVDKEEKMHFYWRFGLYESGLWLLATAHYPSESYRVVSVNNVKVNGQSARLIERPKIISIASSKAAQPDQVEKMVAPGRKVMEAIIASNRLWLLLPLEPRQGLVYEYRQEEPYLERVMFDKHGNIMVQLERSKDSPSAPTRQKLYQSDGTLVDARFGEPFVRLSRLGGAEAVTGEALLHRERRINNLASGLGWDCALTRMARYPTEFYPEVESIGKGDTYRLTLQSRSRDTKIFTGTMLTFTSWAYMHDIRYSRSEIVCDKATNRPLEEKDYDRSGKLVAHYTFLDYEIDPSGRGLYCPFVRAVRLAQLRNPLGQKGQRF